LFPDVCLLLLAILSHPLPGDDFGVPLFCPERYNPVVPHL
jgi:hypothetical protein